MSEKFCNDKSKDEILEFIAKYLYAEGDTAESIYQYFYEQYSYATIPSNTRIVVENYFDGKYHYAIFHSLFGRRVNDCISRAVAFAIARTQHRDVDIGINDNGFFILSEKKVNVSHAFGLLKSSELRKVMDNAIEHTEVFKRRFRHCAMRSLMILRTYMGYTKRVGRQHISATILMNAVKRLSADFSILKESRREVLEDLMDIGNASKVLEGIEKKMIFVEEIQTNVPSPFAFNLVTQGISDVMRIEDKVEFIRRLHQNVLAKIALKKK